MMNSAAVILIAHPATPTTRTHHTLSPFGDGDWDYDDDDDEADGGDDADADADDVPFVGSFVGPSRRCLSDLGRTGKTKPSFFHRGGHVKGAERPGAQVRVLEAGVSVLNATLFCVFQGFISFFKWPRTCARLFHEHEQVFNLTGMHQRLKMAKQPPSTTAQLPSSQPVTPVAAAAPLQVAGWDRQVRRFAASAQRRQARVGIYPCCGRRFCFCVNAAPYNGGDDDHIVTRSQTSFQRPLRRET